MTTYFGILTKIGEAKEANAKALGVPVKITELEIGDGGGVLPVPSREQTSLIGSKHRAPINRIFVDPNNPAWLVVEQVIPEQFGGWWARELGLRDADGDLVAVSNCPPTYKPQMSEGSARTQVVRMVLQVSSTTNFTLKIDPAVVLATRQYVDNGLKEKADIGVSIKAGAGMTGGGTLHESRVISLGMPSTLTASSTNFVGQESHAHALDTQRSVNDGELGRIMTVGKAFGIGADNPIGSANLNSITLPGLYGNDLNDAATPERNYPTRRAGTLIVGRATTSIITQMYVVFNSGEIYSRGCYLNDWSTWKEWVSADVLTSNYARIYSITALPSKNIGLIQVAECAEVWAWSSTTYYTGYRSPLCGRPLDGHTIAPLANEVDAVGGELSKAAYAGLWGYARENGLVVSDAVWTANRGAHYFVDVSSTTFRVPDLRNTFRRYAGTDADTGGSRALGSRQLDALQNITGGGTFRGFIGGSTGSMYTASGAFDLVAGGGIMSPYKVTLETIDTPTDRMSLDVSRVARTASETRPRNVAFHPRIHI